MLPRPLRQHEETKCEAYHILERCVPLAFFFDKIEAVKKIGPFKITPGKAKMLQTLNNPARYSNKPSVFQLALWALGTFGCN